jgi:hypothetical protein
MLRIVILALVLAALAGCAPVSSSTAPAVATLSAGAGPGAATVIATSVPPVATLVTTAIAPAPTSLATPVAPAATLSATALVTATFVAPASTAAAARPVIVVKRSGGIAGQTATWAVYSDGRIMAGGGPERHITPDQVTQLVTGIQTLGFFNLQSSYGQNTACRDCFNYELTVTGGSQTKTVTFVESPQDMPPGLAQILALINGVIGSGQ